jgi:hypothetical protein
MLARTLVLLVVSILPPVSSPSVKGADADLILHHGKIITVDERSSIREAMAVQGNRILRLGTDEEVFKTRGPGTQVVDLGGKPVIPGLIDSHVHPTSACLTELDHPVPDMETIQDVLEYIRARAKVLAEGEWIEVRQVFITRLREQRYPTRDELDRAAPRHPVIFSTGPDASLNGLALRESGIDQSFQIADGGPGRVERDPATGEPTGILRSCTRLAKVKASSRQPSEEEILERLQKLFRDYNSVGITAITDRDASSAEIKRYQLLREKGQLTVRIAVSQHIDTSGPLEEIRENIRKVAADPLHDPKKGGDEKLRIIGIKTYLDGGMLTGSAYMREPWGVSKIYSITDPAYRGVLFIPKEKLLPIVQATLESGLQFTAHSVGDGAVQTLLEAYEQIDKTLPVGKSRSCITHSNFMSKEAVDLAARLGVLVDVQPAWLYLDTRTLAAQFGYDRLRYFQPLRSIFDAGGLACGGSDHMQKIGSMRAINPYNPFLAMWISLTRKARSHGAPLHPEEALSREQALKLYTRNNAYLMFLESRVGSLEEGKLADFAVLDRDLLTCPVDAIKDARVLSSYMDGKRLFLREE